MGAGYRWWKHKLARGGWVKKWCLDHGYPKRQDLTLSSFLATLYDLEDQFSGDAPETKEDLEAALEELKDGAQELLDDTQDSLDAIPEQLQESHMLYERVESLEQWVDSIEMVDLDDLPDHLEDLGYDASEEDQEELQQWVEQKMEDAWDEAPW